MVDYYDWILFAIAAALTAGGIVGIVTGVPMRIALAGSVLVATPFVYDALFRNPPIPADRADRTMAAVAWHAVLVWALLALLV